jgi:hypothetical protein
LGEVLRVDSIGGVQNGVRPGVVLPGFGHPDRGEAGLVEGGVVSSPANPMKTRVASNSIPL